MVTFTHSSPGTAPEAWLRRSEWQAVAGLDLAGYERLVVVAAHPDDETIGAGRLVATVHDAGRRVELVLCTAGERSHPDSPTYDPQQLAGLRLAEWELARARLAPRATAHFLELPDGALADHQDELVAELVGIVGDGRGTLLVAPWRDDGHPDHEAAGRAAAVAARRCGADLLEYPVWWWLWADPASAPWDRLHRLKAGPEAVRRRAEALASYRTQIEPLSEAEGDQPVLTERFLHRLAGAGEVFVSGPVRDDALDQLHRRNPDPWGAEDRWYEERKRRLVLAMLPRERFGRGLEVGCSTGVLTAELAFRCDQLVAVDSSPEAARRARHRLSDTGVAVQRLDVPGQWPGGRFDLVVVSEVGYFLSPAGLDELGRRIDDCLGTDGVLLLCHWRHPVRGWPLSGPEVNRRLLDVGIRPLQASYRDRDVEILVLAADHVWPDPSS